MISKFNSINNFGGTKYLKQLFLPVINSNGNTNRPCKFLYSTTGDDPNIIKSSIDSAHIPRHHLSDFIWKQGRENFPDRDALVDGITGESLSFKECWDLSKKFGSALVKMGVKRGDTVTVMLPNCLAYPIVVTGSIGIGAVLTTQNPLYTPDEIAKQLNLSDSKVMVTMTPFLPSILEAMSSFGLNNKGIQLIIVDEQQDGSKNNYLSYRDFIEQDTGDDFPKSLEDTYDENDTALLLYSSGTTGPPKGVELSHRAVVANVCQLTHVKKFRIIEDSNETHQGCTLGILPLFHIFGMSLSFTQTIHSGAKLVLLPKFDPQTYTDSLKKYKPTYLHLVPPIAQFIAANPNISPDDLKSVQRILIGAAPVGVELYKKLQAKGAHMSIREGWGMSECQIGIATPDVKDEIRAGSCGIIMSNNEVKIIDTETGKTKGPNEVGELCIRGPQNMKCYKNNPEATTNTIDSEGWLHSGDMAYYDNDHFFYIVDRLKELIKVNALQVSPAELEDVISGLSKVADVAVIGIPHEKYGEVPKAFIVKKDQNDSDEDIENLINEHMEQKLASYKQLKGGIEFIQQVPKSPTGKILKKLLKL